MNYIQCQDFLTFLVLLNRDYGSKYVPFDYFAQIPEPNTVFLAKPFVYSAS